MAAAPLGREGTFWHPHRGCRGRHFQARTRRQILNEWHRTLPKTTPARTMSKLYSLAFPLPQNRMLTQYFFLPTSKPDDFSICLLREKKNRKDGQLFSFRGLPFPFCKGRNHEKENQSQYRHFLHDPLYQVFPGSLLQGLQRPRSLILKSLLITSSINL